MEKITEKEEVEKDELNMKDKPSTEVAIFGFGALLNHQKKIHEKLDKIQKFLYFIEKRQQDWFDNFVKPKV